MRLNLVLLAVALLLVGGVAAWSVASRHAGEAGTYDVEVVGPEGTLFRDAVEADEPTALSVLRLAAERHGYPLTLEEYPGMGTYVRAVGEHSAGGASGWVYEVLRGGEWTSGDRSAELFALQKGDALRWSWTSG